MQAIRSSLFVALLAVAACGGKAATPDAWTLDQQRCGVRCERDALVAADAALLSDVRAHGASAALSAAFAADGILLAPRQNILTTPASIHTYLESLYGGATPAYKLSWSLSRADVSGRSDLGYTYGWTTMTAADGTSYPGHYMAVWRREPAEGFRLVVFLRRGAQVAQAQSKTPPAWFGPFTDDGPAHVNDVNTDKALAEVMATDSAFSALSAKVGSHDSFLAYADPQAVEFGGDFIYGTAQIDAAHAGDDKNSPLTWAPTAGFVARSGDLAATVGYWTYLDNSVAPAQPYTGKYLTVWRKAADGTWKWIADAGSPGGHP